MELLNPEGLRIDGRRAQELRKMECELGTLAKADGSATFSMGNTIVTAAVFGPHAALGGRSAAAQDRATVKCEASIAPFSAGERRKRGRADRLSTELSSLVAAAAQETVLSQLLPRTQIDIYLQVLQTDGGTRSCCVNAAMLALADAGVPLRDMVVACSVGWAEGGPLLDLNYDEEARCAPKLTLALQPSMDKVVLLHSESRLAVDRVEALLGLAGEGCRAVQGYMRSQLIAHVRQLATARGEAAL